MAIHRSPADDELRELCPRCGHWGVHTSACIRAARLDPPPEVAPPFGDIVTMTVADILRRLGIDDDRHFDT